MSLSRRYQIKNVKPKTPGSYEYQKTKAKKDAVEGRVVQLSSDSDGSAQKARPHTAAVSLLVNTVLQLLVLLGRDLVGKHARSNHGGLGRHVLGVVGDFDGGGVEAVLGRLVDDRLGV